MRIPDLSREPNSLMLAVNTALERQERHIEHDYEADLVKEVERYLKDVPGAFIWRQNVGGVKSEYTCKKTGKRKQSFTRFGFAGISDFIGCYKGRFVAIECKVRKNKQQPEQEAFQVNVEASGGIYILAYNLGDVIRGLKDA